MGEKDGGVDVGGRTKLGKKSRVGMPPGIVKKKRSVSTSVVEISF